MYGRSKLAAEQAAREFADRVPTVIVRPPFVYGPGDLTNLPPLIAMGKTGVYLKAGMGPKHFSFVHVDDLNQALLAAAERGKTLMPRQPDPGHLLRLGSQSLQLGGLLHRPQPGARAGQAEGGLRPRRRGLGRPARVPSWAAGFSATVSIMNRDKAKEMAQEAWTCSPARATEEIGFRAEYLLDPGLENTVAWYRTQGLA